MNRMELDALLAGRDKAAIKSELELTRLALADNARARSRLEDKGRELVKALAELQEASLK